jgi:deoxyadenosine/deoxycytidine kinase
VSAESDGDDDDAVKRKRQVFITERCLSSDHEVFAKMLHHDQKIDALEYKLYEKWLRQLLKSSTPLGAVVYVDTPPALCADRVKQRHRGGEEAIPLEYLRAVGRYQQSWVEGLADTLPGLPVHTTGHSPAESVCAVEEFLQSLL